MTLRTVSEDLHICRSLDVYDEIEGLLGLGIRLADVPKNGVAPVSEAEMPRLNLCEKRCAWSLCPSSGRSLILVIFRHESKFE